MQLHVSRDDVVNMEIRLRTGRSSVRIPVEYDVTTVTRILYTPTMAQQIAETCSCCLYTTNTFSVKECYSLSYRLCNWSDIFFIMSL